MDSPRASRRLIRTADGSHSIADDRLEETFHSVHGAIQESTHVFIRNGLEPMLRRPRGRLSILEVGLGTGLNVLLTAIRVRHTDLEIVYSVLEPLPLDDDLWRALNHGQILGAQNLMEAVHRLHWNEETALTENFRLTKRNEKLEEAVLPAQTFDLIYFDAFAPSRQPELWTLQQFTRLFSALKSGGVLVTYSAKGQVKRDLAAAGFRVETLPGAPGKNEMIRATAILPQTI